MSKFTRRHYEAIAMVFANEADELRAPSAGTEQQVNSYRAELLEIVKKFERMLQADNPAFRPSTFHDACRLG